MINIFQVTPEILSEKGYFHPLVVDCKEISPFFNRYDNTDYVVTLSYQGMQKIFVSLCVSDGSLKTVAQALVQLESLKKTIQNDIVLQGKVKENFCIEHGKINFLLIVPYLSERILETVKGAQFSAVDLCGNYHIVTPDFIAIRTDQENEYPDSKRIKKVFSGNSAIVSRYLLQQRKVYQSVNEIHDGIRKSGADLALSTVSKVLMVLEDELMITKSKKSIEIIQAEKILDGLEKEYIAPNVQDEGRYKIAEGIMGEFLQKNLGHEWVFSGQTSAHRYSLTTLPQVWTVYAKSPDRNSDLDSKRDGRFYNLMILKTPSPDVYFAKNSDGNWSSQIQCYLEMTKGDRREKEIAAEIRERILEPFR